MCLKEGTIGFSSVQSEKSGQNPGQESTVMDK